MPKNNKRTFKIAKLKTPKVEVDDRNGWYRHEITKLLSGTENVGAELGVAKGIFSKRMIESGKFTKFYGVDLYEDIHNTDEYISTLKFLDHKNPIYSLLRMDFDSALKLFDDNFFDFVYVDGFAHTGEEGGKTLIDWLAKVKVGGFLAGDDYDSNWPLVVWAVNHLASELGVRVGVTSRKEDTDYCKYPSWWIQKPARYVEPALDPTLLKLGMYEKNRINKKRLASRKRKYFKKRLANRMAPILGAFGININSDAFKK